MFSDLILALEETWQKLVLKLFCPPARLNPPRMHCTILRIREHTQVTACSSGLLWKRSYWIDEGKHFFRPPPQKNRPANIILLIMKNPVTKRELAPPTSLVNRKFQKWLSLQGLLLCEKALKTCGVFAISIYFVVLNTNTTLGCMKNQTKFYPVILLPRMWSGGC